MLGLCYWVGVNEKVQNTGEPMPNFFLGVVFFFSVFFFKFSPHMGSAVFLSIGLTQTFCTYISLYLVYGNVLCMIQTLIYIYSCNTVKVTKKTSR